MRKVLLGAAAAAARACACAAAAAARGMLSGGLVPELLLGLLWPEPCVGCTWEQKSRSGAAFYYRVNMV